LLCFSLANHRHAGYRAAEKASVREAGGVAGKIVLLS
jgi:hypothetical protein